MPSQKQSLTFVTVTFAAEMPLLRLQLESMQRFLRADQVAEIIIINNERRRISRRSERSLRHAAGGLSTKLRLIERHSVAALPRTSGWRSQQILKLEIARQVTTPTYVLLDAKNHLIRRMILEDLVAPDGRARGASHSYQGHPLKSYLTKALEKFELPLALLDDFPATATPFVMHTAVVRDLLTSFSSPGPDDFGTAFERAGLTEFFLYSS